jgi:phospholipid/cholesterol/gamma-HCH transport system permease protein
MAIIGFDSLPITLLTIAFSGAVLSLHTAIQAHRFGLDTFVGYMVAVAMSREAGPVLVAVVVAARVGSAIAAEIGTMKVTEQIDALRALAINPIEYLVVPRFIAGVLMLPALTILGDIVGTLGGLLVAASAGVSAATFISSVQDNLPLFDVGMGLLKTLVFGAIIAIIGCRQGLATSGGASGVGKATISTVVISIVLIYIANYFLAALMFGERLSVS